MIYIYHMWIKKKRKTTNTYDFNCMNRNGSTIKTAHNGGSLYAIVQFKFRLSQTGNQSDYGPNWLEWDLVEDIYIAWYNQRIPYAQWMMGTRNSCRVTKSLYTFFSTQRSQLSNSYSHTDTLMPLTSFFFLAETCPLPDLQLGDTLYSNCRKSKFSFFLALTVDYLSGWN